MRARIQAARGIPPGLLRRLHPAPTRLAPPSRRAAAAMPAAASLQARQGHDRVGQERWIRRPTLRSMKKTRRSIASWTFAAVAESAAEQRLAKPHRENRRVRERSQARAPGQALREECASRRVEQAKEQGRRRNIPSTTLPAPDIEIGSRHPVNCTMRGNCTGMCEPVHTRWRKTAECAFFSGAARLRGGRLIEPVRQGRARN